METAELLKLLKLDLTISTSAYDEYLKGLIERAKKAVEREGVALTDDTESGMLIVQYAAYLWRARKGEDVAMPRSLRYELNNRHVSEHTGGD